MNNNKEIIKEFLEKVRSGKKADNAWKFMTDPVFAHQVNSEKETTIIRSPQSYCRHINEFLKTFGSFTLEITELIADGDKVYARWKQTGKHLAAIDECAPTGKPLIEIASCVYRLENNKIAEYWIQVDRLGFEMQLHQNKRN